MREPRHQCASDYSAFSRICARLRSFDIRGRIVARPSPKLGRGFSFESSEPQRAQGRRRWYDRGYRGGTAGRLARRGVDRMFNCYIGGGYFGALSPTASLNGLRVYLAEGEPGPAQVAPPPPLPPYLWRGG